MVGFDCFGFGGFDRLSHRAQPAISEQYYDQQYPEQYPELVEGYK